MWDKVGCAAGSTNRIESQRLKQEASIFTAELTAILLTLQIISDGHKSNFIIFTDSLSVINIIQRYESTHPIVLKILSWLIQLSSRHKTIQFCWFPSHVDVAGNEAADEASRQIATQGAAPHQDELPCRDYYPTIRASICSSWTNT